MKLLSTIILMSLSALAAAHTGDHQGLWHDHGAMAQILVLTASLLGFVTVSLIKRNQQAGQEKVKIENTNNSKSTDTSGLL
jgi:hypothetical protein